MNDVTPKTDPHTLPEDEVDRRIEAIVRRAFADLRAIDPGCDCPALFGAASLLALALDERVIPEGDAVAAKDLVRFLQVTQSMRRDELGYDHDTVDGPIDPRAAAGGPAVRVFARVGNAWVPVARALDALAFDEGSAR